MKPENSNRKYENILIFGSLAYDRIMDFPGYFKDHILPEKIHNINISFVIPKLKVNFGGTAGNIAYNLSLVGEKPYILACAGNDFDLYGKWLESKKINLSLVKRLNKDTASCNIITDKADNQISGFNLGAMAGTVGEIKKNILKDSLVCLSPGYAKDMERFCIEFNKKGVNYIFDPGQQITALSAKALKTGIKGAEILIGNDYEIEMIKRKVGWTTEKIIDKVTVLIITKGEKGSDIYSGNRIYKIGSAKPKRVIDPTGAGDAYRAGIIKGMLCGWDWQKTGQLASAIASFAVEEYGTQIHKFDWKKIEERYKKNFQNKL